MAISVQDFFKCFPDDDVCLDHLMKVRHGERAICPACRREGKFYRVRGRTAYACEWCGHHVYPMVGTPFHRSHVPLQKWFYAMYLFTTTRHGVPAKELQRQLGLPYKTAWRMGHEIRKYTAKTDGDAGLSGHVEVDETMIGGKRPGKRGRGAAGKTAAGKTAAGKTVVFGMLERGGDVMTRVVKDVRRKTLEAHILEKIRAGSVISSLGAYRALARHGYRHAMVTHSADEWVRGDTHVNTVEGFWLQLKRSIRGMHVHVSKKYLPKYLGEFEYRFNMRRAPDQMFARLLLSL